MKLFFDVDGVLIDGWHANPALRRPWNATLSEDMGIDVQRFESLVFRRKDESTPSVIERCATGKRDLGEALEQILPAVGYRGTVDAFLDYWFEKDSRLNADVLALVDELKDCPGTELYIATGQEHRRAAYLWHRLGLSARFRQMFYSAEVGFAKRDIRFFQTISDRLSVSGADRPLLVDDSAAVLAVAGRAGWDGILFERIDDIRAHPRLSVLLP